MRLTPTPPSIPPSPQAPAKAEETWSLDLLKSFWGHYGLSLSLSHSWRAAGRRAEKEREAREESARVARIQNRSIAARVQRQAHELKVAMKAIAEAQRFEQALKTAG